jgi:Uma2 family endonuclease
VAEPAIKPMTVAEFLCWEDGTDTRYELLAGEPLAMVPPAVAHGVLAVRLAAGIEAALRSRSFCLAPIGAAIAAPDRDDTCYVADLAITCTPLQRGRHLIADPLLIVEILSPGTVAHDRHTKVPDYRRIESVREILLIDSERIFAEALRRGGERWITEIVQDRDAALSLAAIGPTVPLSDLHAGIPIAETARQPRIGDPLSRDSNTRHPVAFARSSPAILRSVVLSRHAPETASPAHRRERPFRRGRYAVPRPDRAIRLWCQASPRRKRQRCRSVRAVAAPGWSGCRRPSGRPSEHSR